MALDQNKLNILQSGVFKEALQEVRTHMHPARTLLPESYSMDQRGIQQLRIEEFEKIMTTLESLGSQNKLHSISSTYGVAETPNKIN